MARRTLTVPVLILILAAMMVSVAGTAQARSRYWSDAKGGEAGLLDIRAVKVTNNAKGVRIVVRINPVNMDEALPSGAFTLRIDTKSKRGPEFQEAFGIPGDGGFSALRGPKSWKKSWQTYPSVGKCGKTVRERWYPEDGRIVTHIRPKKGCLWHPRNVRVQVKTITDGELDADYNFTEYEAQVRDYFPARGSFSTKVRYSKK
ncbi:hypothetical protein IDH50_11260 [Aeromicrobium tamlense]|uniref:Uncharacterized protein n=1 Tax=Aeromicrobium tamlense TaxID=375541 RepID=A0A8I0FUJ0_9ACTN|nr:hypothetical protein [Aeromicrobium tamlense]MBD1270812.1 hypothetical protein [Aeromicrobium tamlense]NYI38204.1 hypothetical protein [Aeromicrobium tamlense]